MAWTVRKHTPDTFEKVARKYFRETPEQEWTIPGFCISAGITTRTFQRYAHMDGYEDLCQYIKDLINDKREKMLERGEGNCNGIIFLLKSTGYQDKQQIEVKHDLNASGSMTIEEYIRNAAEEMKA